MSVHSVDHMGPPGSDDGYRGYDIDENGQVVEFYDHTAESSIHGGASGISGSRRLLAEPPPPPAPSTAVTRRRQVKRSAGCCASCVGCLITIGRLPIASAICLLLIWVGTGMFIGAGWAVMYETQSLFELYGPDKFNGNPALDPPPEYFLLGGGSSSSDREYILRNPDDLGNRVPETFEAIEYSFYAIIPFMFFFSIVMVSDGGKSTKELHSRTKGCKSSSAGVCCSVSIIFFSYLLLLAWVFWLAFATLGVYYYRIVMLRCDDLNNRGFSGGVRSEICIDLVQIGLIMYKSTRDEYFGKICGPGTTSNSVGRLEEYCNNYFHAWQLMLVCWSGALLNIIAMMHSLMIVTGNYRTLQRRYMRPARRYAETAASRSPAMTHRTTTTNATPAPPPYIVGTRDNSTNGDYRRRRSKDIELEYMERDDDVPSSSVSYLPPKRFEKDSHVGVDYYYKRY